jgi:hypothetical protein
MKLRNIFRKKPEPVLIYIPKEHVKHVLELEDRYDEARRTGIGYRVARYHFWTYIKELFPETAEGGWAYVSGSTNPYVYRKDSDE